MSITRRKFLENTTFLSGSAVIGWAPTPGLAMGAFKNRKDGAYDAIVIGAGLGGLGCAALMAQNGLRPLVMEQHTIPGGGFGGALAAAKGAFKNLVEDLG